MTMIRVTISLIIVILQYFRSSLYKAVHLTSMILTLLCITIWITIAINDTFELNESGEEDDLFYIVNSVINDSIVYRNITSVNIL